MDLGFVLAITGIAIIIAGVVYFFVLPDEERDFEPQQPATPPDNGEPVEDVREEPELVEQLEVSDRIITALKNSNIRVVAELENLDGELEDIDGIGPAYAEDIRQALREE